MAASNGLDLSGNSVIVSNLRLNSDVPGAVAPANSPTIYAGAGAPTFLAAQGSIYLNTTGSTTATRLYVNTTGSTVWTNFTSAA